jgi:hypothetical protein
MAKKAVKHKKKVKNTEVIIEKDKDANKGVTGIEKRMKNLDKTKWKPGQSGNPKGRPAGILNWNTMNRLAIEALAKENGWSPEYLQVEIAKVGLKAILDKGEFNFWKEYLNRSFGNTTQPIELGGIDGNALSEAQRAKAEAEVEAWQKMWEEDENKPNKKSNKADIRRKGS